MQLKFNSFDSSNLNPQFYVALQFFAILHFIYYPPHPFVDRKRLRKSGIRMNMHDVVPSFIKSYVGPLPPTNQGLIYGHLLQTSFINKMVNGIRNENVFYIFRPNYFERTPVEFMGFMGTLSR
jgi:hypothetical protein